MAQVTRNSLNSRAPTTEQGKSFSRLRSFQKRSA